MSNFSVDVVIPNYNYGRYLVECVDSVLSQNVPRLRVLIIDNASSDGSQDIARGIAAADPRVHLRLRERNLGPHASFNEGIDWAEADYFTILCSDDLLAPGALKRAAAIMDAHQDVHLTHGPTLRRHEDGTMSPGPSLSDPSVHIESGETFLERFCRTGRNPVSGPMAIVRTAIQKRAGYYNSALPHTDDVELWMRFSMFGSVAETGAPLLIGRIHGEQRSKAIESSLQWTLEMKAAYDAFFNGAGADHPRAASLARTVRRSLAIRAYWSAVSHLLRGDPRARELLSFAFRMQPSLLVLPPLGSLLARPDAWNRIRTVAKLAAARIANPKAGSASP